MVYDPTTSITLKFINLQHNLIISYMKLIIEFVSAMDLNTSERNVTARSDLKAGLVDLQKFMFSDRYHLTASALTRVCPSITGLMLWIASFNCCRMYLLLLLLNAFLKVRAVYFKADSLISLAFQCSACSAGAPPTWTSSAINF